MKRASRKSKLVVGGFVLFMCAFAAASVLLFSDDITLFKTSSRYFAVFKNTGGLHVGAPVKMGGVEIGSVVDITINTKGSTPQIQLALQIFSPQNALIRQDSEASLATQGMLGDKFVEIASGSTTSRPLHDGGYLPTKEGPEISAIVDKSTDIINKVSETTGKLETFVDSLPNGNVLKSIAAEFETSSKQLNAILAALNAKDSALREISNPDTTKKLDALLASLQSTAAHIDSVAKKIDGGQGTLGALVNDPALYDDMRQLMGRANRSKAAKFIIQQMLDKPEEKAAP